jgi:ABC-2 type transport system ATP-binding protein
MQERQVFGRSVMLFENVDHGQLAAMGDVRRPSIADLFVAVMGNSEVGGQRSAGVPK